MKLPYASLSPQNRKIVNHLKRTGHITADAAITYYRIMSLSRRMVEIQRSGYPIRKEFVAHPVTGQPYKRYALDMNADELELA